MITQYIYAAMGLPASGKSTEYRKAKWGGIPIHSADEIRVRLFGSAYEFTKENERQVWQTFNEELRKSLSQGTGAVVDNTNLSVFAQKSLQKLAEEYEADIIWMDFTDIPMVESIRRNKLRNKEYDVPNYIIVDMCRKHLPEKFDREIEEVCREFPEVIREWFQEN